MSTHGESGTLLYGVWHTMRSRCSLPTNTRYAYYGARGIRVCSEWDESFVVFRDWAVANGYRPGLVIDRKDTYGNYEPSNCRWVTQKINLNNRRTNHRLTAFGETKTLSEWSEDPRCMVTYTTLKRRSHAGWSPERAITMAARQRGVSS